MAKKRKLKPEPVMTKDEDVPKPADKAGKGATPASNAQANSQLDSDDDDYYKKRKKGAHLTKHKEDEALRRERLRLYELQEAKRRVRQEEGRTKSIVDGETPLLRKVKRLKKERKAIIDEYNTTGGTMKKKTASKKKRSAGIPLPK